MSNTTTNSTLDVERLCNAIEQSDAESLLRLYADEVKLQIIDRNHPPSSPFELHGKDAVTEYFKDICGRDMTHHIEQKVVGENSLAFTEVCKYPNGTRVLCAALLELQEGKIIQQTCVQAWDE